MKSLKYSTYLISLLLLGSCSQEVVQFEEQTEVDPCEGASPGSADFSNFVAVGNSFVAGMQAGALFDAGQANSLPAIINKQLECVGASADFVQPDIHATLGYNLFVTPNPGADGKVLGRLLLQYGTNTDCATGAASPRPTPQTYAAGNTEAIPNPSVNPGFIYGDGSTKTSLNNFGIPAIVLGQALIPQTGAWSGAGTDPRFSPFYGRLAFPGTGTSTLIGDVIAADPSFFLFYLGLDDFFLHAAYGADPARAPLTNPTAFQGQYGAAVGALLASDPNLKGVVGNFPDIFAMPHFTSVAYNAIPLDVANANALTAGFAGYNQVLDGLLANAANFGISEGLAAEIGTRKATFTAGCNNKILILDETLTDLGAYFDGMQNAGAITAEQRAQLVPYEQVRQTTVGDIIPLATGSVLGTPGTFGVLGLSEPLADRWVIVPSEKAEISAARQAYNDAIAGVVAANSSRLALADINAAMNTLHASPLSIVSNVLLTPNINPPTGFYSEDGVHPNARGYAFLSRVFIEAINTKFGSTIPLTPIGNYPATALPIP